MSTLWTVGLLLGGLWLFWWLDTPPKWRHMPKDPFDPKNEVWWPKGYKPKGDRIWRPRR